MASMGGKARRDKVPKEVVAEILLKAREAKKQKALARKQQGV